MQADHPKAQYHLAQMQRHEELLRKIMCQAGGVDEDEMLPQAKRYVWLTVGLILGFCVFVALMYKATQRGVSHELPVDDQQGAPGGVSYPVNPPGAVGQGAHLPGPQGIHRPGPGRRRTAMIRFWPFRRPPRPNRKLSDMEWAIRHGAITSCNSPYLDPEYFDANSQRKELFDAADDPEPLNAGRRP